MLRLTGMDTSPRGLAQTRQFVVVLVVCGGGRTLSMRRRWGRQTEDWSDWVWVSGLRAASLFVGDLVLIDSSRVSMPHPLNSRVLLWLLLCLVKLRHPFIAISPSRIEPTPLIGRFGRDLP